MRVWCCAIKEQLTSRQRKQHSDWLLERLTAHLLFQKSASRTEVFPGIPQSLNPYTVRRGKRVISCRNPRPLCFPMHDVRYHCRRLDQYQGMALSAVYVSTTLENVRNLPVNFHFCRLCYNRIHILIVYRPKLQKLLTNFVRPVRRRHIKLKKRMCYFSGYWLTSEKNVVLFVRVSWSIWDHFNLEHVRRVVHTEPYFSERQTVIF